jgi:uncharacterized protein
MTDQTEPTRDFAPVIAAEINQPREWVAAVLALLDADATIPFIARYRKEATGGLDETVITAIRDRREALGKLADRRAAILKSLEEQGLLTPELRQAVESAPGMAELEDVYLPHKPKRRTRAMQARERGLESLAVAILEQKPGVESMAAATAFVDAEKGVPDAEAALAGTRDIVAEMMAEDAATRGELRDLFWQRGQLTSAVEPGKETEGAKFRDWFTWSEPIKDAPSHRVLALFRGEEEKVLRLTLRPAEEAAMKLIRRRWVRNDTPAGGRSPWRWRTATSAWPRRRWKTRPGPKPSASPTRRPSASSPTTSANCSSPRRWAGKSPWPSIPASAPAARRWCWTVRASCSTTRSSFPPSARARPRTRRG